MIPINTVQFTEMENITYEKKSCSSIHWYSGLYKTLSLK